MKRLIIPDSALLAFCLSAHVAASAYLNLEAGATDTDESILESDNGYKIGFGVKFNDYVAAEFNYVDFGAFDLKSKYLQPLSQATSFELGQMVTVHSFDIEVTGVDLSVLGFLPINDQFCFYGRVGILSWDSDTNVSLTVQGAGSVKGTVSDDGNDVGFGIGLQFKPSPTIGLTLGYDEYDFEAEGDEGEVEFTHLGLKYYFQ